MSLGGGEIMVILLVALLVFGPHRLPELSRQVGGALRELKKMQSTVKQEIADAINLESPPPANTDSGHAAAPPNYDNPDSYLPIGDDALNTDDVPSGLPAANSDADAKPTSGSFS